MPVHHFGIIDHIENENDRFGYDPLKYKCISVDDEMILRLIEPLFIMKTYYHSLKCPEFGLAYWGITIIPPESLSQFYEVVISSSSYRRSEELNDLAIKIREALEQKKHMIHYGV
jgi:hypothetical protein